LDWFGIVCVIVYHVVVNPVYALILTEEVFFMSKITIVNRFEFEKHNETKEICKSELVFLGLGGNLLHKWSHLCLDFFIHMFILNQDVFAAFLWVKICFTMSMYVL